jgi:outer membrane protein assembly factor BamB
MIGVWATIISCRDAASLELAWSVRQGLVGQWGIRGQEAFTVGRSLAVYDLTSGRELRRARLPRDYANTTLGQIGPDVAVTDSALVYGWYDLETHGKVLCFEPKTLAIRWERVFTWPWDVRDTRPTFSVAIDGDHVYALAVGKEGENLFKLRLTDGQTVWSKSIEKYVQGVPLVFHDGNLLVRSRVSHWTPGAYGYYQAIGPDRGQTLWRVRIDGTAGVRDHQPLISGKRVYLTSEASPDEYHLYTIDFETGTILDHQQLRQTSAPFAENIGILYLGGSTPTAYNVERREKVWQTALRGPEGFGLNVSARGVLDPFRNEIYLGDWDRDLYVLSAKSGQVKEKLYIRGYWRGEWFSPLKAFFGSYGVERLELAQGLLFVGTVDKSLFVFRRVDKK